METYEYDLWGRLISITPTEDDTTGITEKNPYRYRSYYYDEETGFYYLSARYYDPQIRRFISADSMNALMLATTDVGCKNLFVYAENNPVTNKDSSGNFVESGFDLVTLAGSIVEVCVNPTDPWAWAGVVGDAVDLVPCVTGVGEAVKALKATAKTAEMADTVSDAVKVADKTHDIYRAVGVDEYYDVMQNGVFKGVEGKTLGAKQFGNSFQETLDFANKSINQDKVAILEVTIPDNVYSQLNHMNLDSSIFKSGTPVVEPEMLNYFNENIINIKHVY